MGGQGQVADDPVWPSHWAYNRRRAPYLQPGGGAGQARIGGPSCSRPADQHGAMASRFRIRCLFWDGDPQFELIALLLQRQLAAVASTWCWREPRRRSAPCRASRAGNFDTYLFQMTSGRSFDWVYRFWHSPRRALSRNSKIPGMRARTRRWTSCAWRAAMTEIREAIGDLRQPVYEDAPAAFLAWIQITRAVDSRFDVGDRSSPEVFSNLWRWHLADATSASR